MKKKTMSKKSGARTKHQIQMDRVRSGLCVPCGGPMVRKVTGVGDVLPLGDTCGPCRYTVWTVPAP